MQAKIRCRIKSTEPSPYYPDSEKVVRLKFETVSAENIMSDGRKLKASFDGELHVKQIVADELKLGTQFSITITDE